MSSSTNLARQFIIAVLMTALALGAALLFGGCQAVNDSMPLRPSAGEVVEN